MPIKFPNRSFFLVQLGLLIVCSILFFSCRIYSFKDVSIDYNKYKTIKINYLENKARIINPQLSPALTDKLQQKVVSQTKLTRTNNDDAHLQISGYVSDYTVSTTGVSAQQAASNRLSVSVHISVKNTVENKTDEFEISRNFDFSANLSLEQAYSSMKDEILKNIVDEIFNKLFSNW